MFHRQRLSRWYRRTARLAASAREIPGLRVISPLMSRSTWPSLPRQMWRKCVSASRDAPFLRRSHNQAATTLTPEIAIAETLSKPHLTRPPAHRIMQSGPHRARPGIGIYQNRLSARSAINSTIGEKSSPAMGGSTLRIGGRAR